MIPLALVTGFLGSGKTTLLKRLIEHYRDRPVAWLVNDFGQVDIDGQLLDLPPDRLAAVPGGSIFCRCLVGEFIEHLQTLSAHDRITGAPRAGVIVETSGVADPRAVGRMLAETRLDRVYRLAGIVAVVDPASFLKLLPALPAVAAQIEAAGTAIINRIDLCDEDDVEAAEQAVREINPSARVLRARFCEVELDILAEPSPPAVSGQYAPCRDPNYLTEACLVQRPVAPELLRRVLEDAAGSLYRAKGFVPTTAGTMYADLSAGRLKLQPAERDVRLGTLVLIFPPSAQPVACDLAARLQAAAPPA